MDEMSRNHTIGSTIIGAHQQSHGNSYMVLLSIHAPKFQTRFQSETTFISFILLLLVFDANCERFLDVNCLTEFYSLTYFMITVRT